jgi:hypothetical protein
VDEFTAAGAYGFGTYTPTSTPVAYAQTSSGAADEGVSQIANTVKGIGHTNNPLFWLLILALVWTGYVFGEFEVGMKRVGKAGIKVGEGE